MDSPIIVNATAGKYYRQPFFYALGHFSKFLVPGSVRIEGISDNVNTALTLDSDANGSQLVFQTLFQRPDNSTVLTVLNKNNQSIFLKIHDPLRGSLVTELAANCLETFVWY